MSIATIATIAVVVLILLAVGLGLFEMSPFARHAERYRDARGRRTGASPTL
ncbi:MAG TPA: hypothetical protein VFA42_03030 [Gaiellaceae bacterium]|nr:hypothetical protein [Gaiellaceae bacterium]